MASVTSATSGSIQGTASQTSAEAQDLRNPGAAGEPKETKKSFEQVWSEIQAKYGGKEEKPREAKKTLGKDDFLKIMVTQLKHQDPTKPMEAEKMATELAQMTSVEQLQNVNKNIEALATKNSAMDRMAMAGLIGKHVTVDKNRFNHVSGQKESLSFHLPSDAATVKVALISESGEVVLEKDMGPQKKGEIPFLWDGKQSNQILAKPGNYMMRIDARSANQQPLMSTTMARAEVVGVNFEGSEPVLLVGNASSPEKVPFKNIVRIEGAQAAAANPVAQSNIAIPQTGGNFFSYKRGEGSSKLDAKNLSPQAKAALEHAEKLKQQAAQEAAAESAMPAAQAAASAGATGAGGPSPAQVQAAIKQFQEMSSKEKGFPSGLSGESGSEAKGGEGG